MRVVLVGAGGHARAVLDALRSSRTTFEVLACTDPDPTLHGETLDGVPIVGDDDLLEDLRARGITCACIGVGGVAVNHPRAVLYRRLGALGFALPAVVHGHCHVAASAKLGPAAVVLAGAVVGAGANVGADAIVGGGAVVEHECRIGDHVHLASGCVLGGGVTVDQGAHVGLGASVVQGLTVGEEAVVGAGAVVIHDVPAGETVVGCPARALGARA
ncbi:MAG TPA: NeuD/PglB/VioB family sugar acetyltransferase [Solirubrobacteraceae bacterium]|jgi:UDP-perosamine 4-acetyltransferase|nr:NeuD/PglB/VioB family sugar acetyltransferase [Solirubrobacteraceae bacterium]